MKVKLCEISNTFKVRIDKNVSIESKKKNF